MLSTNRYLIFIEAKLGSDISMGTTYDPNLQPDNPQYRLCVRKQLSSRAPVLDARAGFRHVECIRSTWRTSTEGIPTRLLLKLPIVIHLDWGGSWRKTSLSYVGKTWRGHCWRLLIPITPNSEK